MEITLPADKKIAANTITTKGYSLDNYQFFRFFR